MAFKSQVPSVTVTYAQTGRDQSPNELGMRPMQERAYDKRGEQYLLIKSPPASGKSRALMFIALDKLRNQGLRQAIVVVPERSIGSSFNDEALTQHGFGIATEVGTGHGHHMHLVAGDQRRQMLAQTVVRVGADMVKLIDRNQPTVKRRDPELFDRVAKGCMGTDQHTVGAFQKRPDG